MDLFDFNEQNIMSRPLADRMRAEKLEEFLGQKHLIDKNSLLFRAIRADKLTSCIFWGPPGCGKSTLANIIANETKGNFVKLNAVTSGVAEVKKVVEDAKNLLKMYNKRTFLLLDECHRFNKTQSDSLLPSIERGDIVFIGSTTENPYIAMTPAIVSRCMVFELQKLSDGDIKEGLNKAILSKKGLSHLNVEIDDDALNHIIHNCHGDLRTAYNSLELAVLSTYPDKNNLIHITKKDAEESTQKRAISVDENLYYDILSAFCKSLRGSDPDAAVYYSERLIQAGCDPLLIARRLVVHSAEDVGLANPNALVVATNALIALEKLGLPEGRIPLTEAIIYVCLSEKSNSVVTCMESANYDAVHFADDKIPNHLRDSHYKGATLRNGESTYLYPHNFGGYVKQQYLPDSLKDKEYYIQGDKGVEKTLDYKKRK